MSYYEKCIFLGRGMFKGFFEGCFVIGLETWIAPLRR